MRFASNAARRTASAQKYANRRKSAEIVRRRAVAGSHFRCDGCGLLVDQIEIHHLFSKGSRLDGIPEWVASLPELQAALCCSMSYGLERLGCHQKIHAGEANGLRDSLRTMAVERFAQWLDPRLSLVSEEMMDDPLSVMRMLIRMAEIKHPDKVEAAQR